MKLDKTCTRCHKTKLVSEFYAKGDTYSSHCKECCREKQRDYNKRNPSYNREYGQAYRDKVDISLRPRKYDFDKVKARNDISWALRSGKLIRATNCEMCGLDCKTQAHHDDYTKTLVVKWLCFNCHATLHRGPYQIR